MMTHTRLINTVPCPCSMINRTTLCCTVPGLRTHVRAVAGVAWYAPCLYSLAPQLLFVWWQNVVEDRFPGYTRVRLSRKARK